MHVLARNFTSNGDLYTNASNAIETRMGGVKAQGVSSFSCFDRSLHGGTA